GATTHLGGLLGLGGKHEPHGEDVLRARDARGEQRPPGREGSQEGATPDSGSPHARSRSQRKPRRRSAPRISRASRPHARPAPAPMKSTIEVTSSRWNPCWPKLIHWLASPKFTARERPHHPVSWGR